MVKKICNILNGILLIILMVLACLLVVPNFIGFKSFAVISGSMEPNIHVGSIVYAKPVDFNELKVGDVISYKINDSTMVTHRINSIDDKSSSFITKGDANDNVDGSPVPYSNVVGKVNFTVPLLGYISINMKTPLGIAMLCGVVAIIIILNFLPEVLEHEKEEDKK